jgi:hypothetical protein
VLGGRAFGKVSAVEGVLKASLSLEATMAEIRRLGNVTPEKRRAALAHKYGKNDAGLCAETDVTGSRESQRLNVLGRKS